MTEAVSNSSVVALADGVLAGSLAAGAFALLGTAMLVFAASILARDRAIGRWPRAPGTVVSSRYERHERMSQVDGVDVTSTTFTAFVTYRYSVAGQTFVGTKVARVPVEGSAEIVKACINRYPEGATVEVLYDRADPATAYLETCVSRGAIFFMLMGAPFALIGFGVGAAIVMM